MTDWLTTLLIFLPVAGALVVWLVPWPRQLARLARNADRARRVGLWITTLTRFDFREGLQFEQQATWFEDLNVSYHVGLYGFSLWLVGLTAVCGAGRSPTRGGSGETGRARTSA